MTVTLVAVLFQQRFNALDKEIVCPQRMRKNNSDRRSQ